jgi:AraC family transcriptional activator of pobA
MLTPETIAHFHLRQGQLVASPDWLPEASTTGYFQVYEVKDFCSQNLPYRHRDFYKVSLLLGPGLLHYADRSIELNRPALVFSNPLVPYAWEGDLAQQHGYFCLFSEDFLLLNDHHAGLQQSPLFKLGSAPVYFLDEPHLGAVRQLFQQLLAEQASDYPYKADLLRTYLNLLLHEALKLQPPAEPYPSPGSATHRLTAVFLELLERQFPIDSPAQPLQMRTAGDYAASLAVHVNYLNRAVREQTGKTTTAHLRERLLREAKMQLQHSDWSIADIAHGLGFEYPTYFTNFFKKHTGHPPTALRTDKLMV